jgi:phenylalanyl-tRNA synthetase beta chain
MRVPLSWLREFVDLPDDLSALRNEFDDLGLVVEGIEHVGEGLEAIVVARVEEIHAIDGADRIRRVIATAGEGPVEIVCGAMNFEVGNLVPFAPVGAVLPGGFEISQRKMRGVLSNGMLCSGRELGLSDDHAGLMILDQYSNVSVGQRLVDLLGIESDVVLEISPEGNRPDAWSIEGVARDYSARSNQSLRTVALSTPDGDELSNTFASAHISAPELCGALTVAVLKNVVVRDSPRWVTRRLEMAGMRAVNNVVDASNYVMLELGQPTHPYDAALVAGHTIGVRQARAGETLVTLDGVTRTLGRAGRGLGDTGVDCVIVDGNDVVVGLAGVMGGESSEISATTTDVLLEAAFFDPMTVARTSKRHGLRSEASSRFERGVDSDLAPRAVARFVSILRESCAEMKWLREPITVRGEIALREPVVLTSAQVEALLGSAIDLSEAARTLRAIGFRVAESGDTLTVVAPAARLDVREGAAGRADVIEEIARLYGYRRLNRRTPTWIEPGGLTAKQRFRRVVRDSLVGMGLDEAWTASLISNADYDLVAPSPERVTITNPLAAEESVLRCSMLVGLARAWARNVERGLGDVGFFEIGVVVDHPAWAASARVARGGVGGHDEVVLPTEHEIATIFLGREGDDARSAVATWVALSERLALADVVVRSSSAPKGWHPTRCAQLVDRTTGAVVGHVGEIDPDLLAQIGPAAYEDRRVGVVEIDLDLVGDERHVPRRSSEIIVPSRYPAASVDLAFVLSNDVNAADLAYALRTSDELVESVELFDVFRGASLGEGVRSVAYAIRLSADDRTLSDNEIGAARERLIAAGAQLGARLR